MAGRPTKFSPVIQDGICKVLRQGNSRSAAAKALGLDRNTVSNWLRDNPAFLCEVEKAEADAERLAVATITAAFPDTWQAAAWWLERRRPNEWGRKERLEVTIRQRAEQVAQEYGLDPDDVIREAERIASLRG